MKPRLLDLFCGAGGAAMGYHRAGFDVVGVDLIRQARYPFAFVQGDAHRYPLDGFDAVHASPPCKAHTHLRGLDRRNLRLFDPHTDQLTPTLARLRYEGMPWVVENVPGAPMPADAVTYCGSSFGLAVRRHRLFASNVFLTPPPCEHRHQGPVVSVNGHPGGSSRRDGRAATTAEWSVAMGIDWMDARTLTQAIPPAYTEHIGRQLIRVLARLAGQRVPFGQ
jgi:DNA (cytosine-5)-methyltransferase 1